MIQGQLNGIAAHNVQQMNNNRAQLLAAYPGRSAPQPPWVTAWPWQGHATSCILPGPPAAAAVADSNQVAWRYRCHSAIADPPPPLHTHTLHGDPSRVHWLCHTCFAPNLLRGLGADLHAPSQQLLRPVSVEQGFRARQAPPCSQARLPGGVPCMPRAAMADRDRDGRGSSRG